MMRFSVVVILIFLVSGSLTAQISGKQVIDEVRIDQKLNEQIPLDLVFRDESGNDVPLSDYFGKRPVILALVYYECPMLCTQILNGMVATFKTLNFSIGNEFDVVTISWHFLTGNQESIDRIAEATGFHYVYDSTSGLYAHASAIMVSTPGGTLARYFFGIEYPARDLTFALMEASENRIGNPVERILLMCYQYDPAAGKYSLLVSAILKISGVITVVVIGGFMLTMLRRERKKTEQTQTTRAER
jgi:protein SCO1/2